MKDIILDVRSSSDNDSETNLCLREVRDRGAYVGSLRGDLLFISEGNGSLLSRGEERVLESGVSVLNPVANGSTLYGGTKILSGGTYTDRGVVLSWSRNDTERKRFSDFELLSGGLRVSLGNIGGEISRLPSIVLGGEIRVGGDGNDGSDFRGYLGSAEVVQTSENVSEYVFQSVEKVVFSADGNVRFKEGEFEEGSEVFFVGVELGGDGVLGVGLEFSISPIPYVYERVYLRVGNEGHIGDEQISYFLSDAEARGHVLGEHGVAVSLSSGLLLLGSGYSGYVMRYEGLLLGRNGDLISDVEVSNGGLVEAGDIFTTGVVDGELDGLSYGSVFLSVGGLRLLPVVRGDKAKRGDRAYFGSDNRIRLKTSVERQGSVFRGGTGKLKLIQSMFPCRLWRQGLSQRNVSTFDWSINLVSGNVLSYTVGVGLSDSSLGVLTPSGHLMLAEGEDIDGYNEEMGLVSQGLGTGVVLCLRGRSVNAFRELEDEVIVSKLSAGSTFTFLDFVPRVDFDGYEGRHFFKSLKLLKENENLLYDFADRTSPKIGWVESRVSNKSLSEPSSFLELEAGVVVGSTSIKLIENGSVTTLVEGVDYDLPNEAQSGVARRVYEFGKEVLSGFKSEYLSGDQMRVYTSSSISVGSYFSLDQDTLYRQVLEVSAGSGYVDLLLSSVKSYDLRGNEVSSFTSGVSQGAWKVFDGQIDETSVDLMKLNDECFVEMPISDEPPLKVYKTYVATTGAEISSVVLNDISTNSKKFIRLDTGEDVPLVVLSREVLETRTVDLVNEHYVAGNYEVYVDDNPTPLEEQNFTVDSTTGKITFTPAIDDLSEVSFLPLPLSVNGRAELLNDTLGLPSSTSATHFVEEIDSEEFSSNSATKSISFKKSLKQGVGVEVLYTPVSTGVQARETILFIKNQELCTRISDKEYSFSSGAYLQIAPVVFVNVSEEVAVVEDGRITFVRSISESEQVSITYARYGSVGGEFVVKVTDEITKPVVTISEGDTSMTLSSRSSLPELSSGDVIGVGNHHFLVSGVSGNVVSFASPSRFNLRVDSVLRSSRSDIFISVSAKASSQKKSSDIFIQGDFRSYISVATVLIINGNEPYYVKSVTFLEEGVTQLTVLGYTKGFTVESFAISIRPVLLEGSISLSPIGSLAIDLGVDLIKFKNGLGISLEDGTDFLLSAETGVVTLKGRHIVEEGVKYILRYNSVITTSPVYLSDGSVSFPKYTASYLVRTDSSSYEGYPLLAKCVIETKDKFLLPIVNEDDYAVEVGAQLLQEASTTTGKRSGTSPTTRPGISVGLFDQLGKDVISRNKILFYNDLVNVVDDWVGSTTGKIVGDQDGKFRFNLEQGGVFSVSAGLEDPITRVIEPRYVSLEFLESLGISLTEKDNFNSLSSSTINSIYDNQSLLVENELDDFVLTSVRTVQELSLSFPFIETTLKPRYNRMWKPHNFSRIYPQRAQFLTTLYPSDVPYSYPNTEGTVIGAVENPARGQIEGISSIPRLTKRPARFRVLDFFPRGVAGKSETVNKPTFLLSAVPYEDFPFNSDGTPDTTQLLYKGNTGSPTIPSVEVGNPELSFKGLSVGMVVELGREGLGFSVLTMKNESSLSDSSLFPSALFSSAPKKVKVKSIVEGCYVVVEGKSSTVEWFGSNLIDYPPQLGDTFLESLQGDMDDTESKSLFFRVGSDVGVNYQTGEIVDISLPSINDPNFPLKEIFEQSLPTPLLSVEGSVNFANRNTSPFNFPALLGEAVNDDGDEAIPYLTQRSERDVLSDLQGSISRVLRTQHSSQYVYPDEIAGLGSISSAKLTIDRSLTPYTDGEIASKDVEQGDLVLIDLDDGATGFIEVSTVEGNSILPPRFKAEATKVRYQLDQYYSSTTGVGLRIGQIIHNGNYLTKFSLSANLPTVPHLTYDNLIGFFVGATNGVVNSFNLQLFNTTFNFAYDDTASTWKINSFYNGVYTNHKVVTLQKYGTAQSQTIIDRGFEVVSPTPFIPSSVWQNDLLVNGTGTTIDLPTEMFTLDGSTGAGEPYTIPLLEFFETEIYVGGVGNTSAGGSETATIEADRLTLKENAFFDNQVVSSSASLKVMGCEVLGNQTDINNTSNLNSNLGFTNLEKHDGGLRVRAFEGHGNVVISKTNMKLSVMTASKVTEGATIYEGTGKTLNYVEGKIETGADDISHVEKGDLIFISEGQSSGTHRVLGAIYEDITSIEVTVVPPRILEMVDNEDGSFTLTMSDNLLDYFDGSSIGLLYFVVSLSGLEDADPAVVNVSGIQVNVVPNSISGAEVTIDGVPTFIDGASTGLTISDMVRVGQDIFKFDKIPFDLRATGAVDFLINPQLSGSEIVSSYNGGSTVPLKHDLDLLSTGVGFLHMKKLSDSTLVNALSGNVITIAVQILKGIYIDPNFPRMCHNYASASPNYFGTATANGLVSVSGLTSETISTISVRRLRRFSDLFLKLGATFDQLNPIYEIRRGLVDTLVQSGDEFTLTPKLVDRLGAEDAAGRETQVGNFSEMISLGDKLNIYAGGVDIYAEKHSPDLRLKVVKVANPLICKYISGTLPTESMSFTVEVRNGVVPQEQTFKKFMDMTFTDVLSSDTGEVVAGKLEDSTPTLDYTATLSNGKSIQNGNYILIDPKGALDTPFEYGAPPKGDTGKVGTTGYVVGTRSPFDDNRGAYKITEVQADNLGADAVSAEGSFSPAGYNLIPSVGGVDGNALSDTAVAVDNTHNHSTNASFSVAPFSYKILERNADVDESFADTILFMRERTLSWMELIRSFGEVRAISWSTYQSEGLVSEIGLEDKTYLTNQEIIGLEGNIDQQPSDVPFVSDSDCLSILDRRFLLEDPRLAKAGYGDASVGLPELLESGISFIEARDKRYSWINVRAGLLRGTLAVIDRVNFDNPSNKALEDINNE